MTQKERNKKSKENKRLLEVREKKKNSKARKNRADGRPFGGGDFGITLFSRKWIGQNGRDGTGAPEGKAMTHTVQNEH